MNTIIQEREVIMKYLKLTLLFAVTVSLFSVMPASSADTEDNAAPGNYMARLYGVIERMPEEGQTGIWTVNDREVLVTGDTKIDEGFGRTEVGAYVEIQGDYVDKTFTVYKIEVKKGKD